MLSVKAIAATAAAAAALLSGCAHSGGDTVLRSATPGAAPALERVPADQISSLAPSAAQEQPQDGGVRPGAPIAEGDTYCTAGWVLPGPDGVPVVITAAHCDAPGEDRVRVSGGRDLGVWAAPGDAAPSGLGDTAALRMTLGTHPAEDAGTVAGHRIRGMIAAAEVEKLPPDTEVCMLGAVSGVHCGKAIAARRASVVVDVGRAVEAGDSGGPVWVQDRDGNAVILGVVSQGSGTLLRAAVAAPIIEAYDLKPPKQ